MKSKVLISVLGALALGACAHYPHHHHGKFMVPDPTRPQIVLTTSGQLVVDQEPLVVPVKEGGVVVTWRLPPGSGLSFDRETGVQPVGKIKNANGELLDFNKDAGTFRIDRSFNEFFVCGPAPLPAAAGAPAKSPRGAAMAESVRSLAKDAAAPVDPQAYVCVYDVGLRANFDKARGFYAYEINVVGPGGKKFKLDPTWVPEPPGGP